MENNYKELKTLNPKLPILIRECSGVEPQLWARYGITPFLSHSYVFHLNFFPCYLHSHSRSSLPSDFPSQFLNRDFKYLTLMYWDWNYVYSNFPLNFICGLLGGAGVIVSVVSTKLKFNVNKILTFMQKKISIDFLAYKQCIYYGWKISCPGVESVWLKWNLSPLNP